jgi:uncharacterized protein
MERLKDLLVEPFSTVAINLEFGHDSQGYAFIRGNISTTVNLICQRCNTPVPLKLEVKVALSPVLNDAEAQQLPEYYDPLLLTSDTMSLNTMVEEELLLSIPYVPKHSIKECPVKPAQLIELDEEEKEKTNPFAKLKKLLRE